MLRYTLPTTFLLILCFQFLHAQSAPITIPITSKIVSISEIKVLTESVSFGDSINLSSKRRWVEGVTNTPNAISNTDNDPWLLTDAVTINVSIINNAPGEIVIYTKHREQDYFPKGVPDDQIINGMINPDFIAQKSLSNAATIPLMAWADLDKEGTVTANPNAHWVWIIDESIGKKQPLTINPYLYDSNLAVYLRAEMGYPKYFGKYVAKVFIEINRF